MAKKLVHRVRVDLEQEPMVVSVFGRSPRGTFYRLASEEVNVRGKSRSEVKKAIVDAARQLLEKNGDIPQ